MKKFLVPTDFSETAKNAARYAVEMAANDPSVTIVLYNIFDSIAVGTDGSLLTETDEDRRRVLNQALSNLEIELHQYSSVKIEYVAEEGSNLVDSIERYVRYHDIDLVVMGITGATRLEQILIGSNALNMARQAVCPVIIVPPKAKFKKIENVLFASDFRNVRTTTPLSPIKRILDIFNPKLHIVNVDSEHYVELSSEYKTERNHLESMFAAYRPEFYFIRMFDFIEAISTFSVDHKIDLIITVPRKHSFLKSFYKTSHTKKLAYHSHIPVIAVHE